MPKVLVLLSVVGILQSSPPRQAPLFAAFSFGSPLSASEAAHFAPDVRQAIEARLAIRKAYQPIQRVPTGPGTIEKEIAWNKQMFEAYLVAVYGSPGVRREAADLAGRFGLAYEWEGMSSGPLGEALAADRYLEEHPRTPLAPALTLFALHRYRCAFEAATFEKDRDRQAESAAAYRAASALLRRSRDMVVLALMNDIDEAAYLYIDEAVHPQTFKGVRPQEQARR